MNKEGGNKEKMIDRDEKQFHVLPVSFLRVEVKMVHWCQHIGLESNSCFLMVVVLRRNPMERQG